MFQANFDEAKFLTLGVGAVNVTFTLVAVSRKSHGNLYNSATHLSYAILLKNIIYDIIISAAQNSLISKR